MAALLLTLLLGPPEPVVCSWYGMAFHGRRTASGETYDAKACTAASPSLPFGAVLLLERAGRVVAVRITDRGPYAVDSLGRVEWPLRPHPVRGLDLSLEAMARLGGIDAGVIEARVWRVL